ncbi:MAG: tRNA (guanosine(37)-N1)-methyltransferase TrmD [Bacilli bacterium]
MKITILTLFPQMFTSIFAESILKRAVGKKLVEIELVDIRCYTTDKYHRVDTPPIGGGPGLVMKAQPLVSALEAVTTPASYKVLLSPRGSVFNQQKAREFAKLNHLVLICGHYEGVDERVNFYVDELVSGGDYILTGGELIAAIIADAVIRLQEGVIKADSIAEESFEAGLLEHPQYTEPYNFAGHKVPDILYSGNHQAIAKYRRLQQLLITREYRPDLFARYPLNKVEKQLICEHDENLKPKWLETALEKGHKFLKENDDD